MRIAIPKGRLFDGVLKVLRKFDLRTSDRDYRVSFHDREYSGKIFKPRAIPQLLAMEHYDVGFCGQDLVEEYSVQIGCKKLFAVHHLGLNEIKLVVAVPKTKANIIDNPPQRPLIIATEYPNIADAWALKKGLAHVILHTWGSTEAYVPEDADIVVDCCETGATLAANGLVEIETIMTSGTCVFTNRDFLYEPSLRLFLDRIRQ